ncbi:hypothetical protein, conserved [Eimeria necatrix]|uniref:Uncharacterized protein n=1 Tax=Eimeria necatrix TaxID=51315 RepID=U6MZV1_9EIME|nr:hypothetical protein, conserved [Eimeria necatrix]CDJ67225.1 hypothetical protein, conserved [Eimeria necatrix]
MLGDEDIGCKDEEALLGGSREWGFWETVAGRGASLKATRTRLAGALGFRTLTRTYSSLKNAESSGTLDPHSAPSADALSDVPEYDPNAPFLAPGQKRTFRSKIRLGTPQSPHYDNIDEPFSFPLLGRHEKHRRLRSMLHGLGQAADAICKVHKQKMEAHFKAICPVPGGTTEVLLHIEFTEIESVPKNSWQQLRVKIQRSGPFDSRHCQKGKQITSLECSEDRTVCLVRDLSCSKSTPQMTEALRRARHSSLMLLFRAY